MTNWPVQITPFFLSFCQSCLRREVLPISLTVHVFEVGTLPVVLHIEQQGCNIQGCWLAKRLKWYTSWLVWALDWLKEGAFQFIVKSQPVRTKPGIDLIGPISHCWQHSSNHQLLWVVLVRVLSWNTYLHSFSAMVFEPEEKLKTLYIRIPSKIDTCALHFWLYTHQLSRYS